MRTPNETFMAHNGVARQWQGASVQGRQVSGLVRNGMIFYEDAPELLATHIESSELRDWRLGTSSYNVPGSPIRNQEFNDNIDLPGVFPVANLRWQFVFANVSQELHNAEMRNWYSLPAQYTTNPWWNPNWSMSRVLRERLREGPPHTPNILWGGVRNSHQGTPWTPYMIMSNGSTNADVGIRICGEEYSIPNMTLPNGWSETMPINDGEDGWFTVSYTGGSTRIMNIHIELDDESAYPADQLIILGNATGGAGQHINVANRINITSNVYLWFEHLLPILRYWNGDAQLEGTARLEKGLFS